MTASYGVDARIEPRLDSQEKEVLDDVAEAMAGQNREAAIAKLTSSSLLNDSAPLLFTLGNLRFEEDDAENARENFARALELYPNFRDAHRNLAVILVQEDELEPALPHLIRAIELGAQDGLSFGLLAYCHLRAGRHGAALQAYRMAQVTMPAEIQWKIGEAECLLALNDVREAESAFAALLEARPTDAGLWLHQANVWLQGDDATKAAANLEMVRRLGRLDGSSLVTLGHLYLHAGLHQRALETWTEALGSKDRPRFDRVVNTLRLLTDRLLWPEARSWADQIQSAYAPDPAAKETSGLQRARALIELESGDAATGLRLVRQLLDRDPSDGHALFLLAKHAAREDRLEEAMHLLEQAALTPDVSLPARLLHGQLLVQESRFEDAIDLLEEVLQDRPDPNLESYLDQLRRLAPAS